MQYVIAGSCVAICIAVLVFGYNVLRESRNMAAQEPLEEEEEEFRRLRP